MFIYPPQLSRGRSNSSITGLFIITPQGLKREVQQFNYGTLYNNPPRSKEGGPTVQKRDSLVETEAFGKIENSYNI
jgi:hypothetical protein